MLQSVKMLYSSCLSILQGYIPSHYFRTTEYAASDTAVTTPIRQELLLQWSYGLRHISKTGLPLQCRAYLLGYCGWEGQWEVWRTTAIAAGTHHSVRQPSIVHLFEFSLGPKYIFLTESQHPIILVMPSWGPSWPHDRQLQTSSAVPQESKIHDKLKN